MMYIDDISGKVGVRGRGGRKKRHMESERERERGQKDR